MKIIKIAKYNVDLNLLKKSIIDFLKREGIEDKIRNIDSDPRAINRIYSLIARADHTHSLANIIHKHLQKNQGRIKEFEENLTENSTFFIKNFKYAETKYDKTLKDIKRNIKFKTFSSEWFQVNIREPEVVQEKTMYKIYQTLPSGSYDQAIRCLSSFAGLIDYLDKYIPHEEEKYIAIKTCGDLYRFMTKNDNLVIYFLNIKSREKIMDCLNKWRSDYGIEYIGRKYEFGIDGDIESNLPRDFFYPIGKIHAAHTFNGSYGQIIAKHIGDKVFLDIINKKASSIEELASNAIRYLETGAVDFSTPKTEVEKEFHDNSIDLLISKLKREFNLSEFISELNTIHSQGDLYENETVFFEFTDKIDNFKVYFSKIPILIEELIREIDPSTHKFHPLFFLKKIIEDLKNKERKNLSIDYNNGFITKNEVGKVILFAKSIRSAVSATYQRGLSIGVGLDDSRKNDSKYNENKSRRTMNINNRS
jgi:hypothetical protein